MEHTEKPEETPREAPEDERVRDEEERRPGEPDRDEAADKAPMKQASAGAASRGSGPARAGS